jgi:biotin carboxylase
MSEHVLIVGNGREIPGLVRAARPGIRTTMLVRLDVLHRVRDRAANARVIGLPHDRGPQEWIEMARSIHARDPFDHLGTYSEKDQDKAAAVGAALGLRTHSLDTIRWVHDKVAMRERLRAAGVDPTPAARVDSLDQARAFAVRHGYPVVVKPVAGAASSGVTVVREPRELDAAWAWAKAAEEPDTDDVLVEAYLDGLELSVEAFSEDGVHRIVALTGKVKNPRHCVELGHVVRGPFDETTTGAVHRFTVAVLDALGVRDGVTHTEVILTADGPRMVETHVRPAGDDIPEMIRDTYGIDLIDLLVQRSLGARVLDRLDREIKASADIAEHAAIWYATPPVAGRITAVSGVDAARELPGVVSVELLKEPGDELAGELLDSRARAVAARAVAGTPEEALRRARVAAEAISFTTEPAGDGAAAEETNR